MRHQIHHQNYRPVIFRDKGSDYAFLTRSTIDSRNTMTWTDGNEYPVVDFEISSASHPFYTGRQRFVDTAGRIEKFRRKFGSDYTQAKKPAADKKQGKKDDWDEE